MLRRLVAIFLCWIAPFVCETASGQSLEVPLLLDATDGELNTFPLLEASLIASGETNVDELQRLLALFDVHVKRTHGADSHRLFNYLHQQIMRGPYDANCADVRATLTSGRYNCVTATVLYMAMGDAHGINVDAIAAPSHVFARLTSSEMDVELTCPQWFDAKSDPAKRPQIEEWHSAFLAIPKSEIRPLTETELLGKIYYNRGVAALRSKQFDEAIRVLSIAVSLDAHDVPAKENLLASYNNYALHEYAKGNLVGALEWIKKGRSLDPHYPLYDGNELHIRLQYVRQLTESGRLASAVSELQQCPDIRALPARSAASTEQTVLALSDAALRTRRPTIAAATLQWGRQQLPHSTAIEVHWVQYANEHLRRQ